MNLLLGCRRDICIFTWTNIGNIGLIIILSLRHDIDIAPMLLKYRKDPFYLFILKSIFLGYNFDIKMISIYFVMYLL